MSLYAAAPSSTALKKLITCKPISGLRLPRDAELKEEYKPDKLCGIIEITADGYACVPDEDDTPLPERAAEVRSREADVCPILHLGKPAARSEMSVYVLEQC